MPEDVHSLEYATGGKRQSHSLANQIGICVATLLGSAVAIMIALPAFLPSRCYARKPLAHAAIGPNGPIAQAIDLFEYNTSCLPRTLDDLIHRPGNLAAGDTWRGPYLHDLQGLMDPWGQTFRYRLRSAIGEPRYHLWSFGPNGIDESSDGDDDFGDDVCNWK